MPTVPISMRKLKEILRLKYGSGLSHRQIGRSLALSPSVVSRYANRAAQLGIKQWPLPPEWDDAALQRVFLQTAALANALIAILELIRQVRPESRLIYCFNN